MLAPAASFQSLRATTPATSELPMGVVPAPTKSMLIALAEGEVVEVTFRITLAEFVREPLVPVMVRVGLPTGVLEVVAIVSVELAPAAIEVGLNEGVAPVGNPLVTLRFTVPVKPFNAATPTVYVVLFPWLTDCVAGEAEIVKLGVSEVIGTIWIPLRGARS